MRKSKSNKMPRGTGCITLFLSFVTFGMGSLLANTFLFEPLSRKKEAATWESVPCLIREIGIERHTIKTKGSSGRRQASTSRLAYSPKVEYEFTYQGQTYTSKLFWFSHRLLNTEQEVEQLIGGYQQGQEYACWVNPKDPNDAVLNRDNPGITIVGGVFGGVLALIGGLGFVGSLWLIFRKST